MADINLLRETDSLEETAQRIVAIKDQIDSLAAVTLQNQSVTSSQPRKGAYAYS